MLSSWDSIRTGPSRSLPLGGILCDRGNDWLSASPASGTLSLLRLLSHIHRWHSDLMWWCILCLFYGQVLKVCCASKSCCGCLSVMEAFVAGYKTLYDLKHCGKAFVNVYIGFIFSVFFDCVGKCGEHHSEAATFFFSCWMSLQISFSNDDLVNPSSCFVGSVCTHHSAYACHLCSQWTEGAFFILMVQRLHLDLLPVRADVLEGTPVGVTASAMWLLWKALSATRQRTRSCDRVWFPGESCSHPQLPPSAAHPVAFSEAANHACLPSWTHTPPLLPLALPWVCYQHWVDKSSL